MGAVPPEFELAFRLLVAAFVVVTPTLMFLALYRGLMALREADLVTRVLRHDAVEPPRNARVAALLGFPAPTGSSSGASAASPGQVGCRHCGTHNPGHATYCAGCLERL